MAAIPPFPTGAGQAQGFGHRTPETLAQARVAAQRAFFQAALGRVQAASGAAPEQAKDQPSTSRSAPADAAPADRIPRPGSIINIVV